MAHQAAPSVNGSANGLAPDQSYNDETIGGTAALQIQKRYGEERAKRIRPEGVGQYIDLSTSENFKQRYYRDPWIKMDNTSGGAAAEHFRDSTCKVLIMGAGFGGLIYAVRLIEAGMSARDIAIIDTAGGFGGTWYWNRYPGLMCDVESYLYMPLLEETGYMPKHKYAYGPELREYCEVIADKWNLRDRAMFQTQVVEAAWDESNKEWVADLRKTPRGASPVDFRVRSQFLITAHGVLNHPQLPGLPDLDTFQGDSFHTSRWDYECTGGSPTDPSLVNLKDKNVAIIGTGATAIQIVPQLAKWAKHLYVFQRTPSAVHERGQHQTDPMWWAEMTKQKGWQRKRNENLSANLSNVQDPEGGNMVGDSWANLHSYCALIGSPGAELDPQRIPAYIEKLYALDYPQTERVRARIDETVNDQATAEKLKPWYPSWCKRPCFHDDYLLAFNQSNVTLVDTDGRGADGLTKGGILYNNHEYKVDVIIFSTGFRSPTLGNPGSRANMTIKGRGGKTLDETWADGIPTLHGVVSHNLPNLFFPGPYQAAATANHSFTLDLLAQHTVYMIMEGLKAATSGKVAVEPTMEAAEAWAMQVMMRAAALAGMSGCTPSYFNAEGAMANMSQAQQMNAAKSSIWGHGILDYARIIEAWRVQGDMEGLQVAVA